MRLSLHVYIRLELSIWEDTSKLFHARDYCSGYTKGKVLATRRIKSVCTYVPYRGTSIIDERELICRDRNAP